MDGQPQHKLRPTAARKPPGPPKAETARVRQSEADAKTALVEVRQEMTTRVQEQRGVYEACIAELALARDEARDRAHRAETQLDGISTRASPPHRLDDHATPRDLPVRDHAIIAHWRLYERNAPR
jgi:hypothetical protein